MSLFKNTLDKFTKAIQESAPIDDIDEVEFIPEPPDLTKRVYCPWCGEVTVWELQEDFSQMYAVCGGCGCHSAPVTVEDYHYDSSDDIVPEKVYSSIFRERGSRWNSDYTRIK
jgi:hypothetical protein